MITPENDVEKIRNALLSKNPDVIINIISKRTFSQRNILIDLFKKACNKALLKEINKLLSYDNNLIEIISLLFLNEIKYDCDSLYSSLNQGNKDLSTIIEIISTRPSNILKKIINKYSDIYNNRNIIKDIENKNILNNNDIIKNILISFLNNEKNENVSPDLDQCHLLAVKLLNEQIKNWFNINSILCQIILNNSQMEIYYIFEIYKKISGNSIIQSINNEINEDDKNFFIEIIKAISSQKKYFAEKINKAIKDKNENIILRIIITRQEIDLEEIKKAYFQMYNKTLINDLKNIFSGDCFKLISNLIGI